MTNGASSATRRGVGKYQAAPADLPAGAALGVGQGREEGVDRREDLGLGLTPVHGRDAVAGLRPVASEEGVDGPVQLHLLGAGGQSFQAVVQLGPIDHLVVLGIDHERMTYRYQGRDFRLTDVAGNLVKPILA